MTILFVKHLSHCKKYLIAYNFNNKIKENSGLLNDILVKNDKINIKLLLKSVIILIF